MAQRKIKNEALQAEAERLDQIKARSMRPDGCGSEIVDIAPARGPVRRFQPREVVMTDSGQVRVTRSGHNGKDALQRADAFDVMMQKGKGRASADAAPMFTAGQISAGRDYAALYERCAAAGIRCSSIEALGGGGQGSYNETLSDDLSELASLDRKIGNDVVLSPRGAQAHADRGRKVMRAHEMVVAVCVAEMTISQLLIKFGWRPTPKTRKKLSLALCGALDRMQGFND